MVPYFSLDDAEMPIDDVVIPYFSLDDAGMPIDDTTWILHGSELIENTLKYAAGMLIDDAIWMLHG